MFYVYILLLNNKDNYVGFSTDLRKRLKEHEQGSVQSTREVRPLKLIYYSAFLEEGKAIKFEKYLKSSSGLAFRNKHLIEKQ